MKKMEAGKTSKRRTENDYYGTYDTDKTPLSTYIPAAFEAIRKQFGLEAKNMRTPNEAKLKKQQERFMQKHQCPVPYWSVTGPRSQKKNDLLFLLYLKALDQYPATGHLLHRLQPVPLNLLLLKQDKRW